MYCSDEVPTFKNLDAAKDDHPILFNALNRRVRDGFRKVAESRVSSGEVDEAEVDALFEKRYEYMRKRVKELKGE